MCSWVCLRHKTNLSRCVCMRQTFDAHAVWAPTILFGTGVSLLTGVKRLTPVPKRVAGAAALASSLTHPHAHTDGKICRMGVKRLTPVPKRVAGAHAVWASKDCLPRTNKTGKDLPAHTARAKTDT